MYWVVPTLTPPCVYVVVESKMGEVSVLVVTVLPFESTCDGSKGVFDPLRAVITIFTGMMYVVMVAVVLVVTVLLFESTCDGSKVVFDPLRAVITIFTGMMYVVMVAVVLLEGAAPTML